ncbi:ATP-dependent zinc protease [Desulfobacula sp.]|uniref:ATP-dependent zinc protease family protein n=1 Tax=Desulfobacula sp. TaxID=2593537 RepID=UPI0026093187|nr:ATP-dependent zinc protease [Desulfobacula sp.]
MLGSQSKLVQEECSIIGWKEWLVLPDLGVPALKAKIDTGARTSALHTFSLEEFTRQDKLMVRFGIHPLRKQNKIELFCEAPVFDRRFVKDSGGHSEMRYVIKTTAILGSMQWPIQITLTNREGMMFRMLLGRTALRHRFVVDPSQAYLTGRELAMSYPNSKIRR